MQNARKNHGIFNKEVKYLVELLPHGMDLAILNKVYRVKKFYNPDEKPTFIYDLMRKYPIEFNLDEYDDRIYYDLKDFIIDDNKILFHFPGSRSWVRNWDRADKIVTKYPINSKI